MELNRGLNQISSTRQVFWTGRVAVGCAHTKPKSRELGSEAERIQTALLKPIEVGHRNWLWHLWHFIAGPR